jgi:hypothetical protein
MEIKDFVTETLVQIHEAMGQARERTSQPHWISQGVKGGQGITFSLAVTNSEEKESSKGGKAGLSIKVLDAKLNASGKFTNASESVSRIEFTIKRQ